MLALVLLVAVMHKPTLRRVVDDVELILKRPLMAKFRDLEVRVDEAANRIAEVVELADVTSMALQGLSRDAVGLLLALAAGGPRDYARHWRQDYVSSRDRGLVEHDKDRLGNSTRVWASALGMRVAATLEGFEASGLAEQRD
jgi:hypothetical protein